MLKSLLSTVFATVLLVLTLPTLGIASHVKFPWSTMSGLEQAVDYTKPGACEVDGVWEPVIKLHATKDKDGYQVWLAQNGRFVVGFYPGDNDGGPEEIAFGSLSTSPSDLDKLPAMKFEALGAKHGDGPCGLLFPRTI